MNNKAFALMHCLQSNYLIQQEIKFIQTIMSFVTRSLLKHPILLKNTLFFYNTMKDY